MYKIIITNGKYQNNFRGILKEKLTVFFGLWSFWLTLDRTPDLRQSSLNYYINYWKIQYDVADEQIQDVSEEQIWEL